MLTVEPCIRNQYCTMTRSLYGENLKRPLCAEPSGPGVQTMGA